MSLIAELKNRKVFRVAAAYAVVGWVVVEVASTVFPTFGIPEWALRLVMLVVLLGFPITLVLAWAVDVTPEGIKLATSRTGNKRFYLTVLVLTALGAGWYLRGHETSAPTVPGITERSIAVLPFVNMSADPSQDYFSDGIAEELLNRLAQFPDLKVAARTSAFQFKGKNLDIGDIGRQLKVSHVLEGSVRKGGSTLRITAQLIDSRTGYHLWSETYDRDASDVLKVQDDIASAIANALETRLGGKPVAAAAAQTTNPAAYDDYLQGRSFIAQRYLDNLDRAIAALDRAIATDPNYSAAYSARGFAQLLRPMWGAKDTHSALAAGRASANKALQLDPNNAEAYMVRGMVESFSRDATSASADLNRARALAPGSVDVLNMDGDFRGNVGDLDAAEADKRRAMELDPLAFVHPLNLADLLSAQGRYEEAIVAAKQSLALGAKDYGYDRLVFSYVRLGRFSQAESAMKDSCTLKGLGCPSDQVLLLAARGQRQQANGQLEDMARDLRSEGGVIGADASVLAWLYLEIGDVAKATAWQKAALDANNWFPMSVLISMPGGAKFPEELSTDPAWLAVWADPRMKDMMTMYRRNLLAWRAGKH